MSFVEAKFKGVDIPDIKEVDLGTDRLVAPNGAVGMVNHYIRTICLKRIKSLQNGTGADRADSEIVKLAAATQKNAYFSGEITVAPADDTVNKVTKLRWEQGHISSRTISVQGSEFIERIAISVMDLKENDQTFKRSTAKD